MAIKRPNPLRARAFTLLEVMLAVVVLCMVSVTVYRIVETTLMALRISSAQARANALTTSFARYLKDQIQALPRDLSGSISGDAHRFSTVSQDELRWVSGPGSGLLTRHAGDGNWTVALTMNRTKSNNKGDQYELGIRRLDPDGRSKGEWLPVLPGVRGFEVRYFDPRSKEWVENWPDPNVNPALVRVRIWREPSAEAYEIIVPLPTTGVPGDMGAANSGAQPNGGSHDLTR